MSAADHAKNAAALAGRLLLAAIFLLEGWSKLNGYAGAVAYMDKHGVPPALLPLVIAIELGAGAMIAIGWQTRLAALALALFCVLAALLFHADLGDRNQILHLEKDLAIAGGLLVLAAFGAGRYALGSRSASVFGAKRT